MGRVVRPGRRGDAVHLISGRSFPACVSPCSSSRRSFCRDRRPARGSERPGAQAHRHVHRQGPDGRALRRRRRPAVPRLHHVLQRGRLGEHAARVRQRPDGIPLGDDAVYLQQVAQIDAIADKAIKRSTPARLASPSCRHARAVTATATVTARIWRSCSTSTRRCCRTITAIDADNFTFGPTSQAEATNEIGKAIPPSLELFNDAKARGITIFLITGRRENTRAHTTSNLTREGFTGYKQLILKPDASTDSTVVYKSDARAAIEQQGYKIVANVGDQYSDLAGGHADVGVQAGQPVLLPAVAVQGGPVRAMLLDAPGRPLRLADVRGAGAGPGQVLLRVSACGVCRTDLHLRDGEVAAGHLPLILGHQIVGVTDGRRARRRALARAGRTGRARIAASGRENLCAAARFTGRDVDGGYAEYAVADERFVLPAARRDDRPRGGAAAVRRADRLPRAAAGRRRRAARAVRLRLGRAHHLPGRACTKAGACSPSRVRRRGARGSSRCRSAPSGRATRRGRGPEPLDAALIFAPAGQLVPAALRACAPGGVVVCAGIHMSDIPSFPYELLWEERVAALGGEPDARRRARVARAGAAGSRSARRSPRSRWRRPRRRWRGCAAGEIEGSAVLTLR